MKRVQPGPCGSLTDVRQLFDRGWWCWRGVTVGQAHPVVSLCVSVLRGLSERSCLSVASQGRDDVGGSVAASGSSGVWIKPVCSAHSVVTLSIKTQPGVGHEVRPGTGQVWTASDRTKRNSCVGRSRKSLLLFKAISSHSPRPPQMSGHP